MLLVSLCDLCVCHRLASDLLCATSRESLQIKVSLVWFIRVISTIIYFGRSLNNNVRCFKIAPPSVKSWPWRIMLAMLPSIIALLDHELCWHNGRIIVLIVESKGSIANYARI